MTKNYKRGDLLMAEKAIGTAESDVIGMSF